MPASRTTFITGATGFIGSALLDRLLEDGRRVSALARTAAAVDHLTARGVRAVLGDIGDTDVLADGMADAHTVFHVAGINEMCAADPDEMMRVNVDGTLAVLRAATTAGVSCLVYTSSAVTVGHAHPGSLTDETAVHDERFVSHYERSKYDAEIALLGAAAVSSMRVVIVNPVSVQGPGRTGGSARLLLSILRRKYPVIPATTVSLVDIADCVSGHLLAETHGVHCARYLLSGAVIDTRQTATILGTVVGERKRPIVVPSGVLKAAGIPLAWIANRAGKESVCPEMIRTLVKGHAYDGSKATRDLGLVYTPVEDTMRATVGWYRDQGLLPSK